MATNYGTGTALRFSDASQRQVLELGEKIHYYNPNVTPIFSLFGMKSMLTPVPIFEWMEDEYMIKKSVKKAMVTATAGDIAATADVGDTTTGGVNGGNSIVKFDKQADLELFEVGGIYTLGTSGHATHLANVTHVMCLAIGKGVNSANATDRMVQFLGLHVKSGDATVYQVEQGGDLFGVHANEVMTLTHFGTAGQYDGGAFKGANGLAIGAETVFVDDKEFKLEGGSGVYAEGAAVGAETSKKVRRLKNCTQIFREPYTITNTAKASKHYGGSEMSRLQARKLAKIKADIEWAILTNGAISLDDAAENPKRTFQGLGLGSSAGSIVSLNGFDNTNLQLNNSSGTLNNMDGVVEYVFSDMVSGSMRKTVFASNKWMVKLASMTRGSDTGFYDTGEKTTSGLRVRSYIGPVGELEFIPHPFLKGAYEDYAIAVDPANFSVRPLAGRDMQLRKDIVKDGRDGQTDEWLMEAGVEVRNEQTHAILKLV